MSISIVFARAALAELHARGIDPQAALRNCQIDPDRLSDLRGSLTLEETALLTEHLMALTNEPAIGLHIGATAPTSMLQLLGQLLLSQDTLRNAFVALRRYAALLDDGPGFELTESGELATFSYVPVFQLGAATRCWVDYTLVMTMRVARLFSSYASPTRVLVQHPLTSYAQRYLDIFDCPVQYEQRINALVFPRQLLDQPQFHADATVRTELSRTAEEMLAQRARSHSLSERVHTFLRHDQNLTEVHVSQVARHVGLSVRGLRRRLAFEGTTLSALVDEARCRVARDRLSRPDVSIKDTAELLGFSETSSFHRAFKRWTGGTAGKYRRSAVSL